MLSKCLPLLLVCAVLQAHAAIYRRCTQAIEGKVFTGDEVNQEPEELAAGVRRYNIPLKQLLGCDPGWVVTVCDLLPPEVVISDDLDSVRVLRTGPMWLPATLEVTRFCTPVLSPVSTSAPPDSEESLSTEVTPRRGG